MVQQCGEPCFLVSSCYLTHTIQPVCHALTRHCVRDVLGRPCSPRPAPFPPPVVARELGVCWWAVMDAVVLHGTPLAEDPKRVKRVRALGIDETSFLSATGDHRTIGPST
jgi:hypothetical protein